MDIYNILEEGVPYLIGVSLVIGAINIKKYWMTPSSLILLYVLILFTTETIGGEIKNNHWLYNVSGILELSVLAVMFYLAIKDEKKRIYILVIYILCMLFLLYECIFITKGIMQFWASGYGFMSLGIAAMGVIYMLELATTEKVMYVSRNLLYWVVIGLLTYQLVNLPVTVLVNNLSAIGNEYRVLIIQSLSGIVMYLCFIIGFIWSQIKYNS